MLFVGWAFTNVNKWFTLKLYKNKHFLTQCYLHLPTERSNSA